MRKLVRPPLPAVLAREEATPTERARAYDHFAVNRLVADFTFALYSHDDVKQALKAMTGGLCAYCEEYYDATQPQDVEH